VPVNKQLQIVRWPQQSTDLIFRFEMSKKHCWTFRTLYSVKRRIIPGIKQCLAKLLRKPQNLQFLKFEMSCSIILPGQYGYITWISISRDKPFFYVCSTVRFEFHVN